MKGQVGVLILLILLITGIIALILVYVLLLPIQALVPPTLEPPVVGVITALLGFLPEKCATLTSIECKYCLVTNKVLPLALNTTLSFIIFSIVFILFGGVFRIGEWGGEEAEGWGIYKGQLGAYSAIFLVSIAFGIFMIHQPDPFRFITIPTFLMAITLRIMAFTLHFQKEENYGRGLLRLTDFIIGAYIVVYGLVLQWPNVDVFFLLFTVAVVTIIVATATVETPAGGTEPRIPLTQTNILLLIGFIFIATFIIWVFINTWLPIAPEFAGVSKYIAEEKLKIGDVKCGENTIGPESSISI